MTNNPLEIWHEQTWEVYDPNRAKVVALFHREADAQEYLEWLNGRKGCEGCNADPGEKCRFGCLSSVPLDTLIEAIEMWAKLPSKKDLKKWELIDIGDYLAEAASRYLHSTGATPAAPVIPERGVV